MIGTILQHELIILLVYIGSFIAWFTLFLTAHPPMSGQNQFGNYTK
jgi:hypothetical protein